MTALATGVAAALAAAGCFAVANTLQHKGASQLSGALRSAPAWRLLTQRSWLAGITVNLAGLGLHALALSAGALAVIQPLLVSGLLFTLPASRLITGRRIELLDCAWAAVVVVGLSVFLRTARATGGHAAADVPMLAAGIGAAGVLVILAVALARPRRCRHRPALLGVATGICCGVGAALLKQVTTLAGAGLPALLAGWPLYALMSAGAAALWLGQTAYRAGPLTGSLPAITIVDPVVAIALGVLAFGESVAGRPIALVVEIAAFATMTAGVVALARRSVEPVSAPVPAQVLARSRSARTLSRSS